MLGDPDRRRELGMFLRSERENHVRREGLESKRRRRRNGLARDELAELADVGEKWLGKIERGDEDAEGPTAATLERICTALGLSLDKIGHAFVLAGMVHPTSSRAGEGMTDGLQAILKALEPNPALVQGCRWDILGCNQAARAVFLDSAPALSPYEQNVVWLMFIRMQGRILDWETHAKRVLAEFRVSWGAHVGESDFEELITDLCAASPPFAKWWEDRGLVAAKWEGLKRVRHPDVGLLTLWQSTVHVLAQEDPKLVVYTPQDAETKGRLLLLAERRQGR